MKLYEQVDKRFLTMCPSQGGSVCWDVTAHQRRKTGQIDIGAGLDITDCSRKIGLEFYSSKPASHKERLAKLDNFIDSLTEFREALVTARLEGVKAIIKYRQDNKGKRFLEPRKRERTILDDLELED